MRWGSHRYVAAAALAVLAGCGVAAEVAASPETGPRPDFTGSWELNPERSDDPRERIDEALRGLPEPPRAGGPGSTTGDARRAQRDQILPLFAAPPVITIRHSQEELSIESALPDRPYRRTLYTDGREFPLAGAQESATAGWQPGGRLVIEYAIAGDRTVKETWELVAEGSRVLVATEIRGRRLAPTIRVQRVYDRVEIVPWAVPD